jgi:hypothetical protein
MHKASRLTANSVNLFMPSWKRHTCPLRSMRHDDLTSIPAYELLGMLYQDGQMVPQIWWHSVSKRCKCIRPQRRRKHAAQGTVSEGRGPAPTLDSATCAFDATRATCCPCSTGVRRKRHTWGMVHRRKEPSCKHKGPEPAEPLPCWNSQQGRARAEEVMSVITTVTSKHDVALPVKLQIWHATLTSC